MNVICITGYSDPLRSNKVDNDGLNNEIMGLLGAFTTH
jgi:hypothetical protein